MSKAAELAALIGSQTALSNRNLIINGAMQVAQRGDSTGITTSGYYGPDRFNFIINAQGTWSVSQSSTAPSGFANSLKFACTTSDASPAASDYLLFYQRIEGQNLQHLKKGTSEAESVTLSFYVRSNKTGTYNCNILDADNTRLIGGSYTINSVDTWEYKTITFAGDTLSALTSDSSESLRVEWWLGSGSDFTSGATSAVWQATDNADRNASGTVNLADSTSNTFYITGVQLEVGEQATPFEHRSYGDELARCQRYYETGRFSFKVPTEGVSNLASAIGGYHSFIVTKRAAPTLTSSNSTAENVDTTSLNPYTSGIEFNGRVTTGTRSRWVGSFTADSEL